MRGIVLLRILQYANNGYLPAAIIAAISVGGCGSTTVKTVTTTAALPTAVQVKEKALQLAAEKRAAASQAQKEAREAVEAKRAEVRKQKEEQAREAEERRATEAREQREQEPSVVGSGHAAGEFAVAQASVTATKTSQMALRLTATPPQSASVTWDLVCTEDGGGVGSKNGQSTLQLPTTEPLPAPAPSESCTVSANAQLSGSGSLEIAILG